MGCPAGYSHKRWASSQKQKLHLNFFVESWEELRDKPRRSVLCFSSALTQTCVLNRSTHSANKNTLICTNPSFFTYRRQNTFPSNRSQGVGAEAVPSGDSSGKIHTLTERLTRDRSVICVSRLKSCVVCAVSLRGRRTWSEHSCR